ncbi:hypothetical protein GCM10007047_21980 [Cerasicoccus arenae]|uniref:Uncharacterized protein n=1 Tax=Cerasicoccus arenae TaxID=424488 RepID=A0A8J3GDU6_9BACT|nr:hypothetical protein GCM10007047_21980 [Cerasicoccus arenae]
MGIDKDAEHAECPVVLDETHATHIRRQIVNSATFGDRLLTDCQMLKVEHLIFHIVKTLMPLIQRLMIHRTDVGTAPTQVVNPMAANEAAAARN